MCRSEFCERANNILAQSQLIKGHALNIGRLGSLRLQSLKHHIVLRGEAATIPVFTVHVRTIIAATFLTVIAGAVITATVVAIEARAVVTVVPWTVVTRPIVTVVTRTVITARTFYSTLIEVA